MDNSEFSDSERLVNPDLDALRRKLTEALSQVLIDWNEIVSLKQTNNTEDRTKVILSFMIKIFETVSDVMDISKDQRNYTFWKWKEKKQLKGIATLTRLFLENNKLDEKEDRQFSNEAIEYKALVSEKIITDDRSLALRAWIPALEQDSEIILVFQMNVPRDRVMTNEIVAIIQTYYEILLMGIRSTDYLLLKTSFFSIVKTKNPNKELMELCEKLIYLEMWRAGWEKSNGGQRTAIDLDLWLNQDSKPIEFNNDEQDYVLASYLTSLMYQLNSDGQKASNKLTHAILTKKNYKDPHIRISRGPAIQIGSSMRVSKWIVAQAIIEGLKPKKIQRINILKRLNDLSDERTGNGLPDLSNQARRVKTLLSISKFESGQILHEKEIDRNNLIKMNNDVCRLSEQIRSLLKTALNPSSESIELSSRWLDAWFGFKLLDTKIFSVLDKKEICDPVRKLELINAWTCYFRYLFDYFILPEFQNASQPDLPTNATDGEVESSRLTLLCEWAHQCGVPRTIPLHAWLSKTRDTELALYTLSGKGSHRQHIFHVQDTCLLGCAMLFSNYPDEIQKARISLLELLAGPDQASQNDLLCNWFVAALLHDIGYSLQVIPRGLEALPSGISKGIRDLVADINQRLEQSSPNVADFDPTPTRANGNMNVSDHAHVSMATVVSHLGSLRDNWRTASKYNPASAAIIDHGSKDTPVDFSTDPLSALIVICDQLQDWGRVRLDTEQLTKSFLANIRMAPGEEPDPGMVKKLFSSSLLFMNIRELDDDCDLVLPIEGKTGIMEFLVHGSYAGEGGYEPAVAWLDICRAFQRIHASNVSPLPEIRVTLQHGIRRKNIPELQRLSRFAHDDTEQRGAILEWLDRVRDKFIRYDFESNQFSGFSYKLPVDMEFDFYEWIQYSIPQLNNSDDRPLKNFPEKLYKSYKDYRKN